MRYLSKTWRPLVAAIIAAFAATPALARPVCYIDALGGGALATNKLETVGASATIAGDGYTAGASAGCDYLMGNFVLGALARYEVQSIKTTIDAATLKANGAWTVAGRAGYMVGSGVMFYALAGLSGSDLKADGLGTLAGKGLKLGAGLELDMSHVIPNLWLGFEASRTDFGKFTDGADTLKPASTQAIARLIYKFDFAAK